jgi:ribokinase
LPPRADGRLPPRLTVAGSVNLDLVARCERLPRPGETVTGASFERVPGGKGANQAVAAARLGADVTFHCAVGGDEFAAEALAFARAEGVDVRSRQVPDVPTGIATIVVAEDGENLIVVAPGANERLGPDDVRLDGGEVVLCQLEVPLETVERAAGSAAFFCLNAAPARELPAGLLERADLVVVNRFELETLGGTPRLVALTLGAEGAVLLEHGEEVARARPPRVRAVDGTGAGDAFTACLLVSLLEERSREEALRRACAAGAIAASRFGAQPSLPSAAEVDAILAS